MHKLWKDKTSFTEANPEASEMAQSYGWVFFLFRRTQVRVSAPKMGGLQPPVTQL